MAGASQNKSWSIIYQREGAQAHDELPSPSQKLAQTSAIEVDKEYRSINPDNQPTSSTTGGASDVRMPPDGGASEEGMKPKVSGHMWDWGCAIPFHHFAFIINTLVPENLVTPIPRGEIHRNVPTIKDKTIDLSNCDIVDIHPPNVGLGIAPVTSVNKMQDYPDEARRVLIIMKSIKVGNNADEMTVVLDEKTFDEHGHFRLVSQSGMNVDREAVFEDIGLTSMVTCQDDVYNCELLPAIACPEWPQQAAYFNQRSRLNSWPGAQLRQEVMSKCCHVVAVPGHATDQWHYNFDDAMVTLLHNSLPMDRQLVVLLKMLHSVAMSFPDIITNYHLTTALLWAKEHTPNDQWVPHKILQCFTHTLDSLLISLVQHNLPHYFLKDVNLFAHVSVDHTYLAARGLNQVRKFPIQILQDYYKAWDLVHPPCSQDVMALLEPVLADIDDAKQHDNEQHSVKQVLLKCAMNVVQVFVLLSTEADTPIHTEHLIGSAANILTCILPMFHSAFPSGAQLAPGDYIRTICLQMTNYRVTTKLYEWTLHKWPEAAANYAVLSNLACIYHAFLVSLPQGAERQGIMAKTKEIFEEAMCLPNSSSVDYCNFLVNCHLYKDAIPLLLKYNGSKDPRQLQPGNTYGESEKHTVDKHLCREITEANSRDIHLLPVVYTHFMLAKCFAKLEMADNLAELIPQFERVCAEIPATLAAHVQCLNWSLLGYTYMDIGDVMSARNIFIKVQRIDHRYPTVTENIEICAALALSMGAAQ